MNLKSSSKTDLELSKNKGKNSLEVYGGIQKNVEATH